MSVAHHTLVSNAAVNSLPLELVDALNQTYFLHLLVTDPKKVIPPGKSLVSMLAHAKFKLADEKHQNETQTKIMNHVKEIAHRAFWKDAAETLSSPLPSEQLPRLKLLYNDLYEALKPLFPKNHPVIISLTSPLPPTSSPLHSTIHLLKEITMALRERCAPVRDEFIDALHMSLSDIPSLSSKPDQHPEVDAPLGITPLAQFVVDKIKAVIELSEEMKVDLNNFVLGSMSESQLRGVLQNDVKVRERKLVLAVWGGAEVVRARWRSWVARVPSTEGPASEDRNWISALFRALESDQPVYCAYPPKQVQPDAAIEETPPANALPPQLLFSTPTLIYIQNYLQAIVITAALRSLTRLPRASTSASASEDVRSEFVTRIWALLSTEIEDALRGDTSEAVQTKLINLADEVVRARQKSISVDSPINPDEEKNLRAAVERTLRSTDPVFILLKKRLVGALEKQVILHTTSQALSPLSSSKGEGAKVPLKMQTGKDLNEGREGKRMKLMFADSILPNGADNGSLQPSSDNTVKFDGTIPGFEDDILQHSISEVLQKLVECIGWVEGIWGDLV
ncbi:hypothetical protein CPC08DRAFT_657283 [Agrocybe pediades]|nr:hypothetical protein CPC08DRAFT_657283 [Agrocybe pediades]